MFFSLIIFTSIHDKYRKPERPFKLALIMDHTECVVPRATPKIPCPAVPLPTYSACLPTLQVCCRAAPPPRNYDKAKMGDNEKNATRHQFSFIRVWIEIRSEIGIIPMGGNGDGGDDDGPVYHPPWRDRSKFGKLTVTVTVRRAYRSTRV